MMIDPCTVPSEDRASNGERPTRDRRAGCSPRFEVGGPSVRQRPWAALGLCVIAAKVALSGGATLTFPNPRLAAHLVSQDGGVLVSGIERGVVFARKGSATYRFAGDRLVLRGDAVTEGIEIEVSADGKKWKPVGRFSGHVMMDADLRPYGEVKFIRFTGSEGVLCHPAVPEQAGAFESPVFEIPPALRKPVAVSWRAGEIGGRPLEGPADDYLIPGSVGARVIPAGTLPGGTYSYAIISTFDDGEKSGNALQGSASVGSGGAIRLTWPEIIGSTERIAREARQKETKLKQDLLAPVDEEKREEKEAGEDLVEEEPKAKEEKEPEYFYEVYRRGPGEELFSLVHRVPKGKAFEWTDAGTAKLGKKLPADVQLQSVTRRKHGQPYTLEPEIESHFGLLPPGKYSYRIAAVLPDGEKPASPPILVEARNAANEIVLTWDEVRGALQYRIYRTAVNDLGGQPRFMAQVAAPTVTFADHGIVEPGDGVKATMEYRVSAGKTIPDATAWQPLPPGGELDLGGKETIQFRATANSSPMGYIPAFAGVTICERGQPAAVPRRLFDVACRWPDQQPWGDYRPVLGPQASPPSVPGAKNQIVLDGRRQVNCVAVAARPGLSCIRDYDVQYFSEVANDWQPLIGVRNNDLLLRLLYFDPVETSAIRFVTFGEPLFGAYDINTGFRSYAVALEPVAVTAMDLDGQRLVPFEAPGYLDMWRPLLLVEGTNRLDLRIRDVLGSETNLTIRVLAVPEKGQPTLLGEKKDVRVAAGGEGTAALDFAAEKTSGWISFELVDQASGKTLYTFQYLARTADPITVKLIEPSYRQTIFESQPDKTIRAEVRLGASPDRLKSDRLVVSLVRQGTAAPIASREQNPITEGRWAVAFDGAALPYGSYDLVAELRGADGKPKARAAKAIHRPVPSPHGEFWLGRRSLLHADGKPILVLHQLGMGGGHSDPRLLDQAIETGFNMLDASGEEALARRAYTRVAITKPRERDGSGWFQRRFETMNTTEPDLIARLTGIRFNRATAAMYFWEEVDIDAEQKKDISAYFSGAEIMKKVDPYHPISTCLFDTTGFIGGFGDACDIYVSEPYLYPTYSDTKRQITARMKKILIWSHMALLCSKRPKLESRRASWAIPMTWDPRSWTAERNARIPSVMEHRCFLFALLNEDITGFSFYNYCTSYFHLKLNPLFWEGHRAVVQEIDFLMPFLLDEKLDEPLVVEPDTASLSLCLYRHGKEYALIAVNTDAYPVRARIRLPAGVTAKTLRVLSESRSVQVVDGAFEDRFGGFGVHLYTTLTNLPELPMTRILEDERFLRGPHQDTQPGNVASETQGATARASYTIWQFNSALFAIDDDRETCWNTSAWATWGKKSGDWVEVAFRQPETIRRVIVRSWKPRYFHDFDDADNLVSDFDLELWQDGKWVKAKEIRDNTSEAVEIPLEPVQTEKLRVVVKKGLTISEIEAYRAE